MAERKVTRIELGIRGKKLMNVPTGSIVSIVGGTASGKSMLLLSILLNYVENNKDLVVLFNLEPENITDKMLKYYDYEDGELLEIAEKFSKLGNFLIVSERLGVEEIEEQLSKSDKDVKLIGIDYFNLLGNKSDDMRKLVKIAQKYDSVIINIVQTRTQSRMIGVPAFEIETMSKVLLTLQNTPNSDTKKLIVHKDACNCMFEKEIYISGFDNSKIRLLESKTADGGGDAGK